MLNECSVPSCAYVQVWDYSYIVSTVTWCGMPVAAAVGWALAVWRIAYFKKLLALFRTTLEETDAVRVIDTWRFHDHREVEILVRLALSERPPDQDASSPDASTSDASMVELAEYVIKCGLAHLSKEPFMFVLR